MVCAVTIALHLPSSALDTNRKYPVRSAPAVMGYGSALAVIIGAFTYTGGRLQGFRRDPDVDEVSRKEHLRKNRRRPVEGTVHELGEGRGKHKQNDGVDRIQLLTIM